MPIFTTECDSFRKPEAQFWLILQPCLPSCAGAQFLHKSYTTHPMHILLKPALRCYAPSQSFPSP